MNPKLITASTSLIIATTGNLRLRVAALCAAAAASTLELFDGTIGTIATTALGVGGTGYATNDLFHLVQAGGGVVATGRVTGNSAGVVTTFTILTTGTGYVAGVTYGTVHTSGSGDDALTITVSTITDAGTSIARLACAANTSANPAEFDAPGCIIKNGGISARITGSAAQGYIYTE